MTTRQYLYVGMVPAGHIVVDAAGGLGAIKACTLIRLGNNKYLRCRPHWLHYYFHCYLLMNVQRSIVDIMKHFLFFFSSIVYVGLGFLFNIILSQFGRTFSFLLWAISATMSTIYKLVKLETESSGNINAFLFIWLWMQPLIRTQQVKKICHYVGRELAKPRKQCTILLHRHVWVY